MMTKPHMPRFEDEKILSDDGRTVEQQRLVCTCGGWSSPWDDMTPTGLSAITARWRLHVIRSERSGQR